MQDTSAVSQHPLWNKFGQCIAMLDQGVLVPSSVVTDLGFPGDTFAAPIPIVPSCLSLKPHVCFLPYSVILWQVISYYESDWR